MFFAMSLLEETGSKRIFKIFTRPINRTTHLTQKLMDNTTQISTKTARTKSFSRTKRTGVSTDQYTTTNARIANT